MGKILKKQQEIQTSALRILGAAFFGFVIGFMIRKIVNYSIPKVLATIQGITYQEAYTIHAESFFSSLIIGVIILFFTAFISGFLAKKSGILVGLIANSLPIFGLGLSLLYFVLVKNVDLFSALSSGAFLQFIFNIIASVFGGLCGEKCYNEKRDLDLHTGGLTIFGIYWMHYFWMAPFIFYPLISSTVIIVYSWMGTFVTILDFASNARLWINLAWWFFVFINPLMILIAALISVFSFFKVWRIMRYKQTYYELYERFIGVLVYGLLSPILVKLIVNFTIKATGNMSRPIINDWKIGVGYILIIPIAGVIIRFIWWMKIKLDQSFAPSKKNV